MALQSLIGPIDAKKLGEEVYELILSNWGNRGAAAVSPMFSYPESSSDQAVQTLTGVSISPRSDIDRVRMNYQANPGKVIPVSLNNFNEGVVGLDEQFVSVDRPWAGQIDGPIVFSSSPDEWYNDVYLPSGAAAVPFGTALNAAIFTAPTLRLLLWFRGLPAQPTRRAPVSFSGSLSPAGAAGVQAEQLLKVLNVHGRRHIRIIMRGATAGGGSTATVRIGGVVPGITGTTVGHQAIIQSPECTLVAATELDINETQCFTLDQPQVQFLTINVARGGGGSTGGALVFVEAID